MPMYRTNFNVEIIHPTNDNVQTNIVTHFQRGVADPNSGRNIRTRMNHDRRSLWSIVVKTGETTSISVADARTKIQNEGLSPSKYTWLNRRTNSLFATQFKVSIIYNDPATIIRLEDGICQYEDGQIGYKAVCYHKDPDNRTMTNRQAVARLTRRQHVAMIPLFGLE